ncbi:hypothetical protein ACH4VT_33135 [Streptomyces lydicus]|uniref:hypothetical protein n=1 Tax=Streptomyces lydicus TaxID=47763 RepID=UPI0037AA21E2
MHRWGVAASLVLIRWLMRELGLEPCQPKPRRFGLTQGALGPWRTVGDESVVGRDQVSVSPKESRNVRQRRKYASTCIR